MLRSSQRRWSMLITHRTGGCTQDAYLKFVLYCIASGVNCVQLREKNSTSKALLAFGHALKALLNLYRVPLIVNDHVDLALALDAEGVHLGQHDEDVCWARKCLGPNRLIGLSAHTLEHVQQANHLPVDYIGCGPVFPTHHKKDARACLGYSGLRQRVALSKHPVVAIGGLTRANVEAVMHTGAFGFAGISLFHTEK